jgi:hypothetical protein
MHETDAMLFIEPVLIGFFDRNFKFDGSEDRHFYELCLEEIQVFIRDAEPYWVKEKSLQIIEKIEEAENQIQAGLYAPATPGAFLDTLLDKVGKRLKETSDYYRLENSKGKTSIFVPLPLFPPQK